MHDLRLLDMPALLASLYRDLEEARARISVEAYIFRSDRLGSEIADRLASAAARGVATRVLYDPHGSIEAERGFFDRLRARGIAVRPYSRVGALLGSLSPAVRNHSRMVIADGVAYTGGYAFGDEWLPVAQGGRGWHDLSCRVTGPVVEDFSLLFERRWAEARGRSPSDFDTGARHQDVRLVSDRPRRRPLLIDCLVAAFGRAHRRIWIENAYFFPSMRILAALSEAARRGVDVRVLIPAESDLRIIARAARIEYADWIAHGIAIWEYLPVVLHAKCALVDDDWCAIGSLNANPPSAHYTIELALIVRQRAFNAALADRIERDQALCRRADPVPLARRPLRERALDRLAWLAMALADLALDG